MKNRSLWRVVISRSINAPSYTELTIVALTFEMAVEEAKSYMAEQKIGEMVISSVEWTGMAVLS